MTNPTINSKQAAIKTETDKQTNNQSNTQRSKTTTKSATNNHQQQSIIIKTSTNNHQQQTHKQTNQQTIGSLYAKLWAASLRPETTMTITTIIYNSNDNSIEQ